MGLKKLEKELLEIKIDLLIEQTITNLRDLKDLIKELWLFKESNKTKPPKYNLSKTQEEILNRLKSGPMYYIDLGQKICSKNPIEIKVHIDILEELDLVNTFMSKENEDLRKRKYVKLKNGHIQG